MGKLAINGGKKVITKKMQTLWPIITDDDKKMVMSVLDSQIVTGPYAPHLRGAEKEFAEFVGTKYAIMTNAGTSAIHIAIAAAGIGPGDEVIVPSFTFLASALGVLHQNAVPVFVDIDMATFNLDPAKIEAKITKNTKAIIPVQLHGLCCDMDPILAIAKKHNLLVIEDCAQAHGATYKGRNAGSMGDMAIFSVQASKNLPCGEGGFFVTNNEKFAQIADNVRLFGQDSSFEDIKYIDLTTPLDRNRMFESITVGWQYLPGEMPAAMLRAQLRALPERNANSTRNGAFLSKSLSGIPGLNPPVVPEGRTHVYHKYRLILDAKAAGIDAAPKVFRDRILAAIQAEGVDACMWESMPVPVQKNFKEHIGYGKQCPWSCPLRDEPAPHTAPEDYAVAEALLATSICLGSHSFPLIAQKMELMELYAEAVRKVFDNISELF